MYIDSKWKAVDNVSVHGWYVELYPEGHVQVNYNKVTIIIDKVYWIGS